MKTLNKILLSVLSLSALALSNVSFSMSADRNIEIEGKLYPNHVKIIDGPEGKKTCGMAHNLLLFVEDNYKKENFDKFNDLNKQFYIKYAKIQLRLVEGKVMKDYCRIHTFYYPMILQVFNNQMKGNKYEPFAKWFEKKVEETDDWIQLN